MDVPNPKFKVLRPEDSVEAQSGKAETELIENRPAVPSELSERVAAALAQRVEREEMSMAGSWARRAAQDTMQAHLDINRALQTARIAMTVGDDMRERLAELGAKTDQSVTKHPELELDYREMQTDTARMLKAINRVTAVGYFRRFHRLGPEEEGD